MDLLTHKGLYKRFALPTLTCSICLSSHLPVPPRTFTERKGLRREERRALHSWVRKKGNVPGQQKGSGTWSLIANQKLWIQAGNYHNGESHYFSSPNVLSVLISDMKYSGFLAMILREQKLIHLCRRNRRKIPLQSCKHTWNYIIKMDEQQYVPCNRF